MSTITAGDYTVELEINREGYKTWLSERDGAYQRHLEQTDPSEQKGPALVLKEYLIPIVEDMVSKQMQKELSESRMSDGSAETSEKKKKKDKKKKKKKLEADSATDAKIADIQFSFRNFRLIEELRTRGAAIAANKYDEMREQDDVITKMINDEKEYEKLTIPTSAFITFESDDA